MDQRLHDFAQLLRQNGLRVSPLELADAGRAALLIDLSDRVAFRSALRATLVKRGADAPIFDRLFELYFSGIKDLIEGLEGSLLDALESEKLNELELEEIARMLADLSQSPLTEALLQGRTDELARILRQATLSIDFRGLTSPLQRGFYARRILQAAGGGKTEQELGQLLAALRARGLDPGAIELVQRRTNHTLERLEQAARRIAEREQRVRDPEERGETALALRTLSSLTPQEVERMRAVVMRLAERLKARLSRRRKVRRRGQLSVRRTLRKNLALGGLPATLVFRSRRQERPEVVVLCDVSDSVRNVSRLMLQFVYTLQSLYSRVRSFVFVSDLGEVTHLFKKADVATAVDLATAGKVVNLAANSNYGHAFKLFHSTYLGSVTRRTSVIIIGDGRTNYNPPNVWALQEIKRRCKRLLWLCPEDRASWGFGDSEMLLYERHCHRVEPVRSVDDLARVASEILP
ncbi:MAG TPA: VWA domain-containing protein [Myxococcales bacterium]|nr:VWA domain-containing protein [Myxococcales bacterium]